MVVEKFNRDINKIIAIADKINKLITVYAEAEGLLRFVESIQIDDVTGKTISIYSICLRKLCSETHEKNMKEYYNVISSFASDTELEDLIAARFFPDYLTIKYISNSLIWGMPREITKDDLEHLNHLYKKYNVE